MGLALASGKSVDEAQEEIQQVVEGVMAAEAVNEVAEKLTIKLTSVHDISPGFWFYVIARSLSRRPDIAI